jgi:hypothetical protein
VRWLRRIAAAIRDAPAGGHSAAFAEHLDHWLGPGERISWAFDNGISVIRYDDRPEPGQATLVTFGLAHAVLSSSLGPIRQELIATVRQPQADGALANRLAYEAELIRNRGRAAEPGEVLLIGEPIGERPLIRGAWAARVHGFEPAFDTVDGADRRFLLVQVVPPTTGEHDRAQSVGGHAFGHDVEPRWSDLLDLDRATLFEPITPPEGFRFVGLADLDVERPADRVEPERIRRLKVGDIAKLRFRLEPVLSNGPIAEQMWVEVDRIQGERYAGRLTNEPQYLVELAPGFELEFERRNVLDVRLR